MKNNIYIAYGEDMDLEVIRSIDSQIEFYGTGLVEGYKLSFKKTEDGTCSSIEKDTKSSLPVVVFTVSDYFLKKKKVMNLEVNKIELEVLTEANQLLKGISYTLDNNNYGIPSKIQYSTILSAYKVYKFDVKQLNEALVYSYKNIKKLYLNSNNHLTKIALKGDNKNKSISNSSNTSDFYSALMREVSENLITEATSNIAFKFANKRFIVEEFKDKPKELFVIYPPDKRGFSKIESKLDNKVYSSSDIKQIALSITKIINQFFK